MTLHATNPVRTTDALSLLQWMKVRVFGGQQFGALISALHTAVFFGLSYVGMTLITGWANQALATLGIAERNHLS